MSSPQDLEGIPSTDPDDASPGHTATVGFWPVVRWSVVPGLLLAALAPGWAGPLPIGVLTLEFMLVVLLTWRAIGPIIGAISISDFTRTMAYSSRRSAAELRSGAMLLLGIAIWPAVHLLVVYEVIGGSAATPIGALWCVLAGVFYVSLYLVGRPRWLLPQVVREFGPLTYFDELPPPPLRRPAEPYDPEA